MLVNLQEILADTRQKHYAVGLFNCVTLEMTKGILAAAAFLQNACSGGSLVSFHPDHISCSAGGRAGFYSL